MNWEAIGAVSETVGALAVLITLVYLAKQIRHSTGVSKVAIYHEAIAQIVDAALAPDFSSLLVKSQSAEAFSPEEESRFLILVGAYIFGHEILLHLYRQGQVDEELWENIVANNMVGLKNDKVLALLESRPGKLSQELLKFIRTDG